MDKHVPLTHPPHADVRRALADDLARLGNYEHETPTSLAAVIETDVWAAWPARELVRIVGSVERLETLTAEPHPVEPRDLSQLDADGRVQAEALLDIIDASIGSDLDAEYRTIAQRMCTQLVAHPDRPLQRKARTERMAAGIVWLAIKSSGPIDRRRFGFTTGDLWRRFEVGPCSDLGHAFAHALDHANRQYPLDLSRMTTRFKTTVVGCPSLLHSDFRADLIDQRNRLKQKLRDDQLALVQHHPIQIYGGQSASFRCVPTTVRWARREEDETGRTRVMVGLGDLDTMQLLAVSVTDARRLVEALEVALNEPAPGLAAA